MSTLAFVCPASGEEVSTGVEMDIPKLSQLELVKIYCPHCQQPHAELSTGSHTQTCR